MRKLRATAARANGAGAFVLYDTDLTSGEAPEMLARALLARGEAIDALG